MTSHGEKFRTLGGRYSNKIKMYSRGGQMSEKPWASRTSPQTRGLSWFWILPIIARFCRPHPASYRDRGEMANTRLPLADCLWGWQEMIIPITMRPLASGLFSFSVRWGERGVLKSVPLIWGRLQSFSSSAQRIKFSWSITLLQGRSQDFSRGGAQQGARDFFFFLTYSLTDPRSGERIEPRKVCEFELFFIVKNKNLHF